MLAMKQSQATMPMARFLRDADDPVFTAMRILAGRSPNQDTKLDGIRQACSE